MRRKILVSVLAVAAVALMAAATAYACVVHKGSATVTGTRGNTGTMVGLGSGHGFCTGGDPATAAAGPAGSSVTFAYAPASCGGTSYQLSAGNYDVRLRNVNGSSSAWSGSDSLGWTQVASSGCFAHPLTDANNYHLADMTVDSTGSGTKSVTLPSSGLVTNGLTDASIFCVGKYGAGTPPAAPTGSSDGFLAPFRVTTV